MDVAIVEVLPSMEFALALIPMPASRTRTSTAKSDDSDGDEAERKKSRRSHKIEKRETAKQPMQQQRGQVQDPQRKAKGKGKGVPMPKALVGGVARTADGQPICFGFNLGECRAAKVGERCPKGFHICTKLGCGGEHPANECLM